MRGFHVFQEAPITRIVAVYHRRPVSFGSASISEIASFATAENIASVQAGQGCV